MRVHMGPSSAEGGGVFSAVCGVGVGGGEMFNDHEKQLQQKAAHCERVQLVLLSTSPVLPASCFDSQRPDDSNHSSSVQPRFPRSLHFRLSVI